MMSAIPESATNSPDWQVAAEGDHKPASLLVQLRRRAFIFPWFRFVYAEGDNTREQRSSSLRTRF